MNSCWKGTFFIIACTLIIAILASILPCNNMRTVKAEEAKKNEPYSYVMFAGGDGEALKIEAKNVTVNGNIFTNGKINVNSNNANINGKIYSVSGSVITTKKITNKVEKAELQSTLIINNRIKKTYFTDNCDNHKEAFTLSDKNLNINKALYSMDSILLEGNANMNAATGAVGNITLKGNCLNANNSVIYSETGDITFNYNNTNVTGLIYAPKGKVIINSKSTHINGVVIAKKIEIISNNVNLNYNNTIAEFVGNTTESECPEFVQLADGKIDGEYLYRIVYTNLLMKGLSIDNVLLADDYDKDGLTLADEYKYDTDPFSVDTDEDGLDDYSEINTYHTKPSYKDTDMDGMKDGTEIACQLDPLKTDSDSDGVQDSEETVTQEVNLEIINDINIKEALVKPEVQITGRGDYSNAIYAEDISYNKMLSKINGIVGHPFDFVHDKDLKFDSSKLTFAIDDSVLANNSLEDLVIAYYNPNNGGVEILKTECNQNTKTISAQVNHYSIYMVLNYERYIHDIKYYKNNSIMDNGKADIVFIVNTTSYMSGVMGNVKTNLNQFLDELQKYNIDAQLKIIPYQTYMYWGTETEVYNDWKQNNEEFRNSIDALNPDQNGRCQMDFRNALEYAKKMEFRSDSSKHIIWISDNEIYETSIKGNKNIPNVRNNIACLSIETEGSSSGEGNPVPTYDGITYSTISPKVGTDAEVIATNGVDALITDNFAVDLKKLLTGVSNQSGDGCWVRLTNGNLVKLDKNPALGDRSVDTDKDGIPDLSELRKMEPQYYYDDRSGAMVEYAAWSYRSDPTSVDTDGDGLVDSKDITPLRYDMVIIHEDKDYISFNTSKIWYKINYNSIDYIENVFSLAPSHQLTDAEMVDISMRLSENKKSDFNIEELSYIAFKNIEGVKFYLNNRSSEIRDKVFFIEHCRNSKYLRNDNGSWVEAASLEDGGFFKGKVISEADLAYSLKIIGMIDIYDTYENLNILMQNFGLLVCAVAALECAEVAAPVLIYYIKTYGVKNGLQLAYYFGATGFVNGVMTYNEEYLENKEHSADEIAVLDNGYDTAVEKDIYDIPEELGPGEYKQRFNEIAENGQLTSETVAEVEEVLINAEQVAVKSTKWYDISKYYDDIVQDLRTSTGLTSPTRNMAYIETELNGVNSIYKAYSSTSEINGFVKLETDATQRVFNTIDVGNYNRYVDTEAKILEQVAKDLGACRNADGIINWGNTNASSTINLYTELQPCPSCDGVIAQFKQQYPNIKLNVYWTTDY